MGQTANIIKCKVCGNETKRVEDFYTLSVPLPIKNHLNYEITYVPRCTEK